MRCHHRERQLCDVSRCSMSAPGSRQPAATGLSRLTALRRGLLRRPALCSGRILPHRVGAGAMACAVGLRRQRTLEGPSHPSIAHCAHARRSVWRGLSSLKSQRITRGRPQNKNWFGGLGGSATRARGLIVLATCLHQVKMRPARRSNIQIANLRPGYEKC